MHAPTGDLVSDPPIVYDHAVGVRAHLRHPTPDTCLLHDDHGHTWTVHGRYLDALEHPHAPPTLLLQRLREDAPTDLQGTYRHAVPLLRVADAATPYSPEEEAILGWALAELLRLLRLPAPRPWHEARRLDTLCPRWCETFHDAVAQRARRTPTRARGPLVWRHPETIADEVFERLFAELLRDPHQPALLRLQRRLHTQDDDPRPTSQLIHNALYTCVDLLQHPVEGRLIPRDLVPRPLHPLDDVAPGPRVPDTPPHPGASTWRRLLPRWGITSAADAHRLLLTLRQTVARGLERLDPPERTWLLLEFMSRLDRRRIADLAGLNYHTLRARFPRSGTRRKRPPAYVVDLLPPLLHPDVDAFGELFPALQFALLPDPRELDACSLCDASRRALEELSVSDDLDARGDCWKEVTLRRVAQAWGGDVDDLLRHTLLPTLAQLSHLRAAQPPR